ncbi:MAG: hypothetical protein JXB23_06315 [Candidatus Aminicenantes bacterium]|nr:hypothetical protein [Candidatus Aminicenantes bacterium]
MNLKGFYTLSLFLILLCIPPLNAKESQAPLLLQHTPVGEFFHGDILSIQAWSQGDADWVRFSFRYEGVTEFQVRDMTRLEDGSYSFEFDTSQIPGLAFEYYITAQIQGKEIYLPQSAPAEVFTVIGQSAEPMPEIPEEFPSPEEEAEKFKLPMSINGSLQATVMEKSDMGSQGMNNAGNVRVFTNYSKGKMGVDFDSNMNYSNRPLEGDNNIDLSNMMLSVSVDNHNLRAGDIDINESEFTIYGMGRRGVDYAYNNQKAYVHIFDLNSQQPKGFDGFGIPRSGINLLGGAVGYKLFNDVLSMKAVYIAGKDDPSRGVNVGSADFFKKREGNVVSVIEEANLWQNRVNLTAEFAHSNYDEDLDDQAGTKSDNAWKIGGNFNYGRLTLGANYSYVGADFNSIGYQYFTNDRKGLQTNIGYSFGNFSIMGGYNFSRDNLDNDASQYTTENQDGNLGFQWNISSKLSFNVGYRRSKQDTSGGNSEWEAFNQDSLANEFSGNLNVFLSQSVSLNFSAVNSRLSSQNNPAADSSNMTLNLGGSFRAGQTFSLSPSLGYSQMKNLFTNEITHNYNTFLISEIFFWPETLSTTLSGSFSRMDGGAANRSDSYNVSGDINFYLSKVLHLGNMVLSLRGLYNKTDMPGFSNSTYSILAKFDFAF